METLKLKSTTAKRKITSSAPVTIIADGVPSSKVDSRNSWIANTAYLKAATRGFLPGHELDDWLEAESEYATRRGH